MILLDSSVLIEFYRPEGRPDVRLAVARAIEADQAAVNGVIQTEILSFVRTGAAYRELSEDFRALHWLDLDRHVFDRASQLGFDLRRHGITIPATDLVIAASALCADATLCHTDVHFDRIAEHSELSTRSFLDQE